MPDFYPILTAFSFGTTLINSGHGMRRILINYLPFN